jgi:hypothetical protein
MLPPIAFENGKRICRKPLTHSMECIPPQPFLDLMKTHGVPWQVMDLPVSN